MHIPEAEGAIGNVWYGHPDGESRIVSATQRVSQGAGRGSEDGNTVNEISTALTGESGSGDVPLPKRLEDWSTHNVSECVRGLTDDFGGKAEEYAEVMKSEHVSGKVLLVLKEEDLRDLGFSLGHRKLLIAHVDRLRD